MRGEDWWERFWPISGLMPVEDAEGHLSDVLVDDALAVHAFYGIEQTVDVFLEPAPYEVIDRLLCQLEPHVFMRWFLTIDRARPVPPRAAGPAAVRVVDEAHRVGRRVTGFVEIAGGRRGLWAEFRDALFGLIVPQGRRSPEARTADRLKEAVTAVRAYAAALRSALELRPLGTEDIVRAFFDWLGLPDDPAAIARSVRAWREPRDAFLPGWLAACIPVGDVEFTPQGVWFLLPDGTWRLWRFLVVLDHFADVRSSFWRTLIGETDFPFRAVVTVAPASQAFTLRQLRHKLNIQANLSQWRVRSTAVAADVAAAETEAAYREILRENYRILRMGILLALHADVPVRDERGERLALESVRSRIHVLWSVLERLGCRSHIEWIRQKFSFRTFLPGAREFDLARARQTLPRVVTNLLPVHLTRRRYREDDEVVLFDRLWQPRTFRLFDPGYGLYTALVSGRSRSGKSFLANLLVDAWSARDDIHVVVIDTSRSYVRTARARGFRVYEIDSDPDRSWGIDIVAGLRPEMYHEVLAAASIIADMAAADGRPVARADEIARNLEHYIRTAARPSMRDFVERTGALSPYGAFFRMTAHVIAPRPDRSIDFRERRVLVNVDPRLSQDAGDFARRAAALISRALMLAFQKAVYTSPFAWKVLVKDESWADLADTSMAQAYELAFRTFAKFKGGALLLTQSIADITARAAPGVAEALMNNAGYKLFFAQNWHEAMWRAGLGETPEASRTLWEEAGIRSVPGEYSEFLLLESVTGRADILRVRVPRDLYELYQTTHMEDVAAPAVPAGMTEARP